MVQIIIICITVITCVIFSIYVMQRNKHLRNEYLSLKTMFDNIQSYVFLIDNDVIVIKTNYYKLNPDAKKEESLILGNVLRCKNGCDAGLCGKSPYCAQCSIREHITNALQTKSNFKNLETHMSIYTTNHNVVETDVVVDGKYVEIKSDPYMVIDVKDITSTKTLQRLYFEEKLRSQRDNKRYLSLISKIIDNISSPFNTLNGYVSMFLNAKTPEERENGVRFIGTQAIFIKNWIEDFVSHDIMGQIKLNTVDSNARFKSDDVLPKLLVTTTNIELFNKIKDFTINKFSVEMKQSDIDLAAHAVVLFNVFAVIVDLPEDRQDNLTKTLHSIKPKLPILILTDNTNKDKAKIVTGTHTIYMSSNFNQADLITNLNILDV